ncbi:MAG: hypothetical protein H6737_29860 [Alphaproteobacteria bacterium]|nr:hypothetical protein [Alphaproteobacteria bacterium]
MALRRTDAGRVPVDGLQGHRRHGHRSARSILVRGVRCLRSRRPVGRLGLGSGGRVRGRRHARRRHHHALERHRMEPRRPAWRRAPARLGLRLRPERRVVRGRRRRGGPLRRIELGGSRRGHDRSAVGRLGRGSRRHVGRRGRRGRRRSAAPPLGWHGLHAGPARTVPERPRREVDVQGVGHGRARVLGRPGRPDHRVGRHTVVPDVDGPVRRSGLRLALGHPRRRHLRRGRALGCPCRRARRAGVEHRGACGLPGAQRRFGDRRRRAGRGAVRLRRAMGGRRARPGDRRRRHPGRHPRDVVRRRGAHIWGGWHVPAAVRQGDGMGTRNALILPAIAAALLFASCKDKDEDTDTDTDVEEDWTDHGPIADGILAPLGQPRPSATPEQLATFERGLAVGQHRFTVTEGLGPAFNTVFCLSCHEKPTPGGSAGMYRSFFLTGRLTNDGAFLPGESAGNGGGVIRLNYVGEDFDARPQVPDETTIIAQRNPIPFFGVGLLAEITDDEILRRADPDDSDGDGISGKANYDRGFVGRFGRKSQTVSIEGFIRGPLFNHLGVTTDPLSDAQRALLPVDSSGGQTGALFRLGEALRGFGQAAAPDGPLTDEDGAPDPEMSTDDLFDLVSYAMLLAAPEVEPLNEVTTRGRDAFNEARCFDCHTPRLTSPRGKLPVYSDLLLHDMGPELADGLQQKDATGSEFRTQPLWGVAAVGPYLHDGRAKTLHQAIEMHGGEGSASRDRYLAMGEGRQADLREFLLSLGGRGQASAGLIPADAPVPPVGEYGGPVRALDATEAADFVRDRTAFDTELAFQDGLGGPRFNGDSCRACHFEPVPGGAGPLGLNVMRHGILNGQGEFVPPAVGTILHRLRRPDQLANRAQEGVNVYEPRQTPHVFGLGLIDAIDEADILANADPDDLDADGISGRPSWTDDGRLGRFGWKGSVPSIAEFVRDAVAMELGMTLTDQPGLTFGRIQDNDEIADPELGLAFAEEVAGFLRMLGPPPRQTPADPGLAAQGEGLFASVGCASCHVPALPGPDGDVPLYSDLLLHAILPPGSAGIEEAGATMEEFRTAPLWGISKTAPYLHDGRAETLDAAILGHDGEAVTVRDAFEALSGPEKAALLAFLETL